MRFLPYGERAVLAELDDHRGVAPLAAAAAALPGIVDAVAGATTVLAVFDPAVTDAATVRAGLAATGPATGDATVGDPTGGDPTGGDPGPGVVTGRPGALVELPVDYDGADLAAVARLSGLSVRDVVAVHSGGDYTVRFCGFSPGFAYLDGLDPRLHVPRRDEPRTFVPAGSVAVAGGFTGVYPRSSPGGWQVLGRTATTLWDVSAQPPALLVPGTRVRFVPT